MTGGGRHRSPLDHVIASTNTKAAARPRRARRLSIQARPARAEAVAIETALEQSRSVQQAERGFPGFTQAARGVKAGSSSPVGFCSEREGWMAALCSVASPDPNNDR